MKGKGNKDVHILCGEGYIPPEPIVPMKKNSIRKSILVSGDPISSSLFTRRVKMTQNQGEISSPSELIVDSRGKRAMPSIEELNEEKPHGEENNSKLSKRDLSSSHESDEEMENPDSLIKRDSDRVITLDQDINLSPRRSQTIRSRIQATRIPSFNELDIRQTPKASPYNNDKDRKSIQQMIIPVPDDDENEENDEGDKEDNFMPDEIESPGLKNIKRKFKDEARLSQLSPRSPFMKRTSMMSIAQLNNLAERETPQIPSGNKKTIELHRIEDDSPSLSPINLKQTNNRDLIIPIVTPDASPKKDHVSEDEPHNRFKHRASLKYSKTTQFTDKLAEMGEIALNEIRTPQGVRTMSQNQLREIHLVNSKKDHPRKSKDIQFRYGTKDEISINFSRKGSVEDIGSDSESDKSDKNSADDQVDNFTEFEKHSDQEEIVLKSPKFIEELKRKLSLRYQNISNFCLGIVCLDMILSELYFFSDTSIKHDNNSYHIIYLFIIVFTLILMVLRINVNHLDLFKGIVLALLFTRLLADFVEIYLYLDDVSFQLK
jgi:hypothetical protein